MEEKEGPRISDEEIKALERPHSNLLIMYLLQGLAATIAFPIVFGPLFFKYYTLRYRFDDEGISARWGILFRKEIYLTYRRIQDIHVSRNLFERWLGIGKVEVQTASGSSAAELVIEGMPAYDSVRDFLYARMRGAKGQSAAGADAGTSTSGTGAAGEVEVIALLREIKGELEGTRRALEARHTSSEGA